MGHFIIDGCSSVGSITRLGPVDLFSFIAYTGWEEDIWSVEFSFGDCGKVVGARHCWSSLRFLRCCSLALVLLVTLSLWWYCIFVVVVVDKGGGGGGGGAVDCMIKTETGSTTTTLPLPLVEL